MVFSPRPLALLARPFAYALIICGFLSSISVLAGAPATSAITATKTATPTTTWYRGNTHTHTSNSDGDSSPLAMAAHYKELGYNFVVITDHNRLTDVDDLMDYFSLRLPN